MSPSKKLTRRSTSDAGLASRLRSALARDAEAQLAAAARVRHRYEMGSKTKAYKKDLRMLQADANPTDALIRRKEIRGGFETAYLRERDAPASIGESQFRLEKVEQATDSGVMVMVRRFDEHGKLIEALKQSPDQTEVEHWQVDAVGELRRVYFRTMHRGVQLTETLSEPDANGDRVLARSRNGNTQLFVLNSDGFIGNYGPQVRNRDPYASTLVNAPVPGKITLERGFISKKVLETYYDGSQAVKNYRLGSKRNETRLPPNPPYANRAPLYQSSNHPPPPYQSPANSPHVHASVATGPSDPRAVGMPNMSPEAQAALAVVDAAEAAKVARNQLQIAEDHALAVKLQRLDAETDMHLGGAAPSQSLQHDAATLTTQATDAVLGSLGKLMPSTDLTALRQTLKAALMPILSQVEVGGITTLPTPHAKTGASSNFSYPAPLLGRSSSQANTGVEGSRNIGSFTSSATAAISGHVNPPASLASSSRLALTTIEPNTLNGGNGVRMAPSTLQSDLDALESKGSRIRIAPRGDEGLNGGSSRTSALGSTDRPSLLDRINSGRSNNSESSNVTALGHGNLSDFLNSNQSGDDKAPRSAEASSAKSAPIASASTNEGRPSLLERGQGPVGEVATEPPPAPGSLGDIFKRINEQSTSVEHNSKPQGKTNVSEEQPLLRKADSLRDYPLSGRADLLARKVDGGRGL